MIAGATLFALGGSYPWMAYPILASALLLAIVIRPSIARGSNEWLDLALIACLVVLAAQLVPLPARVRVTLSPGAAAVERTLRLDAASDPLAEPPRPLSMDPSATAAALAIATVYVVLFWCARDVFGRGGVRRAARTIGWIGLALTLVALVQHATAPRLVYWTWPVGRGAVWGPFFNHSDFATWIVMALAVTVGYTVARIESRRSGEEPTAAILARSVDATAVWSTAAVCLMSAGLLVALSRSGLMAAVVALVVLLWAARPRLRAGGLAILVGAAALVLLLAATFMNPTAASQRLQETITVGLGGRKAIWQETAAMIRDFWRTGVGAGAYARVMAVYQPSPHVFYYNHAHNEYLQLAAEGGVLLAVPALCAALIGAWQIGSRLCTDRSPIFWVRAGAASAVVAIAVQSIWETGLRVPANGVLFAIIAALALHHARR